MTAIRWIVLWPRVPMAAAMTAGIDARIKGVG